MIIFSVVKDWFKSDFVLIKRGIFYVYLIRWCFIGSYYVCDDSEYINVFFMRR